MIASRLAPQLPGRVIIGGRDANKANIASGKVGWGALGREIDVSKREAIKKLDDVFLVLVCLDQKDTHFVAGSLSRGIHYIDITAQNAFLAKVEALDAVARGSGAIAVLSVGTAPGLSNLLVAHTTARMSSLERIDILLEFGLGDHHGLAAIQWMVDNLDTTWEIVEDGQRKHVRSFDESRLLSLPGIHRPRRAYRFNFADQHVVSRIRNGRSVSTWVRFDNGLITWVFSVFTRSGLSRILRYPFCRKFAVWLFMKVRFGSDICAVAVSAKGQRGNQAKEKLVGVIAHNEAKMTAVIAAETAAKLVEMPPEQGVFHIDQVMEISSVIEALKREYSDLIVVL